MRAVVADSNVMVKWFVEEEYTECAEKLRDDHLRGLIDVHAPGYALLEFSNAMRKYVARGIISRDDAESALNLLIEFDIAFHTPQPEEPKEAVSKALRYSLANHVTVYDAYYVILAKDLGTKFYTADDRLLNKLRNTNEEQIAHICEYR